MMCKYPFIRSTTGVQKLGTAVIANSNQDRLNATPMPCGRCLHCRINARRTWTHRIMLELKQHPDSVFITLTYSDAFFVKRGHCNLDTKDAKNFIQRLRRNLHGVVKFRYMVVGEYGGDHGRAHLHAILFGLSKLHTQQIVNSWCLYGSQIGVVDVGEVNLHSAAYIAGYTIKKLTKEGDPKLNGKTPEFMRSSRKGGGLGKKTVQEIGKDLKNKRYWEPQIISEFQYGKKKLPLGKYLTDILSEESGVTEKQKRRKLTEYQNNIFIEHLEQGELMVDNILKSTDQKRLNQETTYKLFGRKRGKLHTKTSYKIEMKRNYRYYKIDGKLIKEKIK